MFDPMDALLESAGKEALVKAFEKLHPGSEWIGFVAHAAEIANGSKESEQILAVVGVLLGDGAVEIGKDFTSATDCHGITVVHVEPPVETMCHEVRVAINADNAIDTISQAANAISGTAFPDVVDKYSNLLGKLQFELNTDTPTGTGLEGIIEAWSAGGFSGAPQFAIVYYPTSDPSGTLYKQQRDVLLDKMGFLNAVKSLSRALSQTAAQPSPSWFHRVPDRPPGTSPASTRDSLGRDLK